jgi:hypothetical protein
MLSTLPEFDEDGNLPPGIHHCSFDELAVRFGTGSPEREVEIAELGEFLKWAHQKSIKRILVNGSFVTSAAAPNDVDVVILPATSIHAIIPQGSFEMLWPFLQILVAADDADFEAWAPHDFATNRDGKRKGVVELII